MSILIASFSIFGIVSSANNESVTDASEEANGYTTECGFDTERLYMETNQKRFDLESLVTITFVVHAEATISEIYYDSDGFDVLSATIDENNNSKINVVLNYDDALDCFSFAIGVILDNGNELTAFVYAVKNEFGIFISSDSLESATDESYAYMMSIGKMTEDERLKLKNEYNMQFVTVTHSSMPLGNESQNSVSSRATFPGGNTRLIVNLAWKDFQNVTHELCGGKIEIYDQNAVNDKLLGTFTADLDGMVAFDFNNPDRVIDFENGGYDLYVKIYPCDPNNNIKVLCGNSNEYMIQTTPKMNVSTGLVHYIDITLENSGTVSSNNGTSIVSSNNNEEHNDTSNINKAFQIYEALFWARRYVEISTGTTPNAVTAKFPIISNDKASKYFSSNGTIEVDNSTIDNGNPNITYDYQSWDTIMHEYAHHIQHQYSITASPGGAHSASTNLAIKNGSKNAGLTLAWAEGWATAFSQIAQDVCSSYISDVYRVADARYDSKIDCVCIENCKINIGECNEISVAGALWDMYDIGSEVLDSTNGLYDTTTVTNWLTLSINSHKTTFWDFISYYYQGSIDRMKNMGGILSYHGMAPLIRFEICSNGSGSTGPYLVWNTGENGTLDNIVLRNNQFRIMFYDDDGNFICETSIFNSNTTVVYYRVPSEVWQTVVNNCTLQYTVYIMGQNTSSPTTGYYMSAGLTYSKP